MAWEFEQESVQWLEGVEDVPCWGYRQIERLV